MTVWGNGPLRRPQQAAALRLSLSASYRGNQHGKNKCIKWSWQRCLFFTAVYLSVFFSGCNRLSSRTVPLSSWSSLRTFMEPDRLGEWRPKKDRYCWLPFRDSRFDNPSWQISKWLIDSERNTHIARDRGRAARGEHSPCIACLPSDKKNKIYYL